MSWCLLVGVPILRLTLAVKASGVSLSALLEGWQNLDRSPRLLFGKPQFVKTLQIQPKLGARAKEMTKAQGCVTSNGALSIRIPVMRLVGTFKWRASSAALGLRVSNSSAR